MEPRQLLEKIKAQVGIAVEEVTFAKYLEMVEEDPRLARLSHALIGDTIDAGGLSVGPDGEERFDLFEGELFLGIKLPVSEISTPCKSHCWTSKHSTARSRPKLTRRLPKFSHRSISFLARRFSPVRKSWHNTVAVSTR